MNITRSSDAQKFNTPNAIVTPHATGRTGAKQVSVIHQRMESGRSNPQHTQTTEEVMYMLSGNVDVVVDGKQISLSAGDSLTVPANVPHSIENSSGSPSEWLIISPAGMQFCGPDGNLMSPDWAK